MLSLTRPALVAVAAALALAACGGSSSTSSTATTKTITHTATATSSSTSATSSGQNTVTVRAHAANANVGPSCHPAKVEVSVGPSTAGLGHVGESLLFHNAGSGTCVLTGYPGVTLVRSGGGSLQVPRSPSGYLGGLKPGSKKAPVLRVGSGQTVSALLEGLDSRQPGGGPCPSYHTVLVTPPNFTLTTRLARAVSVCLATVHPVVAGTTGRQ
ncbi:MAG: DUF4232 domain-containing protein [Solirubrobacteraceae bacterium]